MAFEKAADKLTYREYHSKSTYILGVDLNRRGADQTAFTVLEKRHDQELIYLSYLETHNFTDLTDSINRILYLHSIFNFRKIYIDTTGLGSGVGDVLKQKLGGGVVEEVIFTRKSKPEMFNNLKLLMQQRKIRFPNYLTNTNPLIKKMFYQFLSIQTIFNEDSDIARITHENNTHDDIICAICLAALYFSQKKLGRGQYFLHGNYDKG